jgi:hypothetical protein
MLSPRHRLALQQARRWIDATLDPAGLLVSGSLVRGEGHARSDLDLVVLWRRRGRQRLQRRFDGVPAEIFANSADWLRHTLRHEAEQARPVMAHLLATGVLLHDEDGTLATLVAEARAQWQAGPAPSPAWLLRQRYHAATAVEDALDLADRDDGDARLARHRAVDALLEHAFVARGQFLPRAKQRLALLRALDPAASAALCAVLDAVDAVTAATALSEAAQRLIGTDGFFEWDSAVEDGPPG